MLTSKQRAFLRSLATDIDTIVMVGKGGMSEQIIKQADDVMYKDKATRRTSIRKEDNDDKS